VAKSLIQNVAGVQDKLVAWWEHEDMDTPCLLLTGPAPGAPPVPDTDDLEQYWWDIDWALNLAMRRIESRAYYGVALPFHWPDWGASTFAGVLGANMERVAKETFWAYPCCETLEDVLDVDIDPDNRFYRTVLEMTRRSVVLSHDHHFVACYPIVGVADILAGLYGTEKLLLAMVERPDAVKAAMEHVKRLWLREFDATQTLIESAGNPGNINWMSIWAPGRTCATQEDISYMISPHMFREFCLPPLVDLIDSLDYAMYHLDGPGSITHVDTLLSIPNLRAIQWVPGAGREDVPQWYDLIQRILAGGKSVEVFARVDEIDDLVATVGSRGLLIHCAGVTPDQAEQLLEAYPQA
jgi:hypothetical protein